MNYNSLRIIKDEINDIIPESKIFPENPSHGDLIFIDNLLYIFNALSNPGKWLEIKNNFKAYNLFKAAERLDLNLVIDVDFKNVSINIYDDQGNLLKKELNASYSKNRLMIDLEETISGMFIIKYSNVYDWTSNKIDLDIILSSSDNLELFRDNFFLENYKIDDFFPIINYDVGDTIVNGPVYVYGDLLVNDMLYKKIDSDFKHIFHELSDGHGSEMDTAFLGGRSLSEFAMTDHSHSEYLDIFHATSTNPHPNLKLNQNNTRNLLPVKIDYLGPEEWSFNNIYADPTKPAIELTVKNNYLVFNTIQGNLIFDNDIMESTDTSDEYIWNSYLDKAWSIKNFQNRDMVTFFFTVAIKDWNYYSVDNVDAIFFINGDSLFTHNRYKYKITLYMDTNNIFVFKLNDKKLDITLNNNLDKNILSLAFSINHITGEIHIFSYEYDTAEYKPPILLSMPSVSKKEVSETLSFLETADAKSTNILSIQLYNFMSYDGFLDSNGFKNIINSNLCDTYVASKFYSYFPDSPLRIEALITNSDIQGVLNKNNKILNYVSKFHVVSRYSSSDYSGKKITLNQEGVFALNVQHLKAGDRANFVLNFYDENDILLGYMIYYKRTSSTAKVDYTDVDIYNPGSSRILDMPASDFFGLNYGNCGIYGLFSFVDNTLQITPSALHRDVDYVNTAFVNRYYNRSYTLPNDNLSKTKKIEIKLTSLHTSVQSYSDDVYFMIRSN